MGKGGGSWKRGKASRRVRETICVQMIYLQISSPWHCTLTEGGSSWEGGEGHNNFYDTFVNYFVTLNSQRVAAGRGWGRWKGWWRGGGEPIFPSPLFPLPFSSPSPLPLPHQSVVISPLSIPLGTPPLCVLCHCEEIGKYSINKTDGPSPFSLSLSSNSLSFLLALPPPLPMSISPHGHKQGGVGGRFHSLIFPLPLPFPFPLLLPISPPILPLSLMWQRNQQMHH